MEGIERAAPLESIAVEPLLPDADLTLVSDDDDPSLESESESSYGYGRSRRRAKASAVEKVDTKALEANIAVLIPTSNLIHPRSICVHGFEPPAPPASEAEALKSLLPLLHDEEGDYLELELDDFTVENSYFKSFDALVRRQLDPIWHKVGPKTKRLVADLTTLRNLLRLVDYPRRQSP